MDFDVNISTLALYSPDTPPKLDTISATVKHMNLILNGLSGGFLIQDLSFQLFRVGKTRFQLSTHLQEQPTHQRVISIPIAPGILFDCGFRGNGYVNVERNSISEQHLANGKNFDLKSYDKAEQTKTGPSSQNRS